MSLPGDDWIVVQGTDVKLVDARRNLHPHPFGRREIILRRLDIVLEDQLDQVSDRDGIPSRFIGYPECLWRLPITKNTAVQPPLILFKRGKPQFLGQITFPGFKIPFGSSAALIRRIVSSSSGLRE